MNVQDTGVATTQGMGLVSGVTKLFYTETPAGRPASRSVEWPGASSPTDTESVQYNAYGQVDAMDYPGGGNLGSFSYTMDGDLLGYSGSNVSESYQYTTRGELATPSMNFANGVPVPTGNYSYTWDDVMGAPLQRDFPNGTSSQWASWTYDGAGRLQNDNGTTRTYDVENHLLCTKSSAWDNCNVWGANGHPAQVVGETLHWSGNQLLFTTNAVSGGTLDDIKIGSDGDILPADPNYSSLTLYERGPGGEVGGCYTANSATGFLGKGPSLVTKTYGSLSFTSAVGACGVGGGQGGAMPVSPQWWGNGISGVSGIYPIGGGWSSRGWYGGYNNGTLGMLRPDGFETNTDVIQGVRSYDQNAGIWTTPDFYQGDLMDPMTLKSYAWNGNNPLANVDPTGFLTESLCGSGMHINQFSGQCVYDAVPDAFDIPWQSLFQPPDLNGMIEDVLSNFMRKAVCPPASGAARSFMSNAPSSIGTASMSLAANGTLGIPGTSIGVSGQFSPGIAIDHMGDVAVVLTFGGSLSAPAAGASGFIGGNYSLSNAPSVEGLGGPFGNASITGGDGLAGGLDGFLGSYNGAAVVGGGLSAGLGVGASGSIGGTDTGVFTACGGS